MTNSAKIRQLEDTAHAKRLEIAVKYNEKFKRELIAEKERLSERLNELQTLFPQREIPAPTNNVGADEWR